MIRRSADIDGQQACLARETLILRCSSAGNDGQVASLARETLIRRRRSADIDGRGTSLARRASLRRESADIDGRRTSLARRASLRRESADIDGRRTSLARRASLRRKSADIDGRGASLGPPLHQRRDLRHDGWLPFLRLAHPLNAIMFDRSPTFNASLQSKSTEPGAKGESPSRCRFPPGGFRGASFGGGIIRRAQDRIDPGNDGDSSIDYRYSRTWRPSPQDLQHLSACSVLNTCSI